MSGTEVLGKKAERGAEHERKNGKVTVRVDFYRGDLWDHFQTDAERALILR